MTVGSPRTEAAMLWRFLAVELADIWTRLLEGAMGSREARADSRLVWGVEDELRERTMAFLEQLHPGVPVNEEGVSAWPPTGDCCVLDLVDGTNSLLLGAPFFGLQFALVRAGTAGEAIEEAVLFLPAEERLGGGGLYRARRGAGAFYTLRGETDIRLRVSEQRELATSTIAFDGTTPNVCKLYHPALVSSVTRIRNFGAFCWAGTRLARGRHLPVSCDAVVAIGNRPWDHLPSILLVEEAGGTVTGHYGPYTLADCTELVLSNGHLHPAVLRRLHEILPPPDGAAPSRGEHR
ncbi:MAG: hypothetical protein K0V04_43375 [Deltaproteobacteria bacterium]|nr:hypothetical protein [Deltaproteobacteria bacterium]